MEVEDPSTHPNAHLGSTDNPGGAAAGGQRPRALPSPSTGDEPAIRALGGTPRAFERFIVAYRRNVPAAAAALCETIRFRAEHNLDSGAAPAGSKWRQSNTSTS